VIFLGAAMFRFTEEEIEANRPFLREIEPAAFLTRDLPTWEAFKDCCEHSYAGIDSAFFAPDVHEPFRLALPPYIAVAYDRFPEPRIEAAETEEGVGACAHRFRALGLHWGLSYPRLQEALASRGKFEAYLGALADFRRLPSQVGGYMVVRPGHRFNPHVTWKIYRRPQAVASDEPWTFFTLYAGAELALSDRVHACVAALAYGRPAMLYRHTKRACLLDRVGAEAIGREPVTVPPQRLAEEKRRQIAFLRRAWEAISQGEGGPRT
jgi:hypothetical protein